MFAFILMRDLFIRSAQGVAAMESQELPVDVQPKTPGHRRWRRWTLLTLTVLLSIPFAIAQLSPDQARRCGPLVELVFQFFHRPVKVALSDAGQQFISDIQGRGGSAEMIQPERRFFGLLPGDEKFVVSFIGSNFDNMGLAALAAKHGDRIGALHLSNTGVTDDGLKQLKEFSNLDSVSLVSPAPILVNGTRVVPISDDGMANLELKNLVNLNLDGLPITDAGLKSLPDLPSLRSLRLMGTRIEGTGLSRIASFPKLEGLFLDGCPLGDNALVHLAGLNSLRALSLNGIPLSAAALKHVVELSSLRFLSIRGCQVRHEDVELIKAKLPLLHIER